MLCELIGLLQTAAGIAFGALDALLLRLRSPGPIRVGGALDAVALYRPRAASAAPALVLVAPPLLGTHESPNVASVARACLDRGWFCAVHCRPDDPPNVFGNTDSLARAFLLAKAAVPEAAGRAAVVGMSAGSFQAARCLPALADHGAGAVVLMANALTLRRVDGSSAGAAYLCRKVAARLRVPCPESRKLGDLCEAVGVDPRDLDCRLALARSRVPTLCVNSMNDPVVPRSVAPALLRIAHANRNVSVWITRRGGHLGWVGPLGRRYAVRGSLDFVAGALGLRGKN